MVKSKIFLRFIASYIIILLLPTVIIIILIYTSFVSNLKKEVFNSTSRMLLQVSDNMDVNLQDLRNISNQISVNPYIQPLIFSQNIDQLGIYPIYLGIRELHNFKVVNSLIENIFLCFDDSDLIISDITKYDYSSFFSRVYMQRNNVFDPYYNQLDNLTGSIVLNTQKVYVDGQASDVISYIQPLPVGNFDYSITLIITMKESLVRQMIQKVLGEHRGFVYILDPESNIILGISSDDSNDHANIRQEEVKTFAKNNKSGDVEAYKSGEKEFVISNIKSSHTGWSYVAAIESSELLKNIEIIKNIYILIILGIFSIGLMLAYYFSRGNYRDIKSIFDTIMINNNESDDRENKNEWVVINNAVKKYLNENLSLQNKLSDMMPVLRNNFLLQLLKGNIADTAAIQTMADSFGFKTGYGLYAVILLEIDLYEQSEWNVSDPRYGVIKLTIANIAEDFCSQDGAGYAAEVHDKIAVIVFLPNRIEDDSNIILKKISGNISYFLNTNFKLGITAAISNTYHNPLELAAAYSEAQKALEYRLIKGENTVICYSEIRDHSHSNAYVYSFEQESKIVNLIRLCDSEGIKFILSEIVNKLKSETNSLEVAKCIYFEIVNTAIKSLKELGIDFNIEECLRDILRKKSLDEVYKEVCNLYVKICDEVRLSKNIKSNELRDKLIVYLAENYSNSNLSEDDAAGSLGVSVSYLSRYFKDQFGVSFVDYIHGLRLGKAKELLARSRKSLSVISREVGYNSAYNFNRVFKRYEKITPMDYRTSMNSHIKS